MEKLKTKFDFLSDALFAIIMTIIVLEIKVPADAAHFPEFLHSIGVFLLSFVILANFWFRRASTLLSMEKTYSVGLFSLDLLFHALIALIPVFNQLLISFTPRSLGVVGYGSLITLVTLVLNHYTNTTYEVYLRENQHRVAQHLLPLLHRRTLITLFFSLLLIGVAYLEPNFGMYIYIIFPIFEILMRTRHNKKQKFDFDTQAFLDALDGRFNTERQRGGRHHRNQETETSQS